MSRSHLSRAAFTVLAAAASAASAQTSNIKPPVAQAWIDVATVGGMGMPAMPGAGGNPLAALGGLFGGGGGGEKNTFGNTQSGATGRWVDVTLYTRNNPSLTEAQQAVPAGFLSPALKLQAPREVKGKGTPEGDDDRVIPPDYERPKGRMLLYWGCGASVRPGQPKVLDLATAAPADMANFFVSRRATQRGTHSALGRPDWPSPLDPRTVPANASLVGEHAFSGAGVPEGFRFQIPAAQDLMPPLQVRQTDQGGASELTWTSLPTARAYFIAGMGTAGMAKDGQMPDMVIWTSSELPETGSGLLDYQTNSAVDGWLRDKVLLAPTTTQCTVPKGVFPGQGAMLRMIAYGSELNLVHPPRPQDPKAPWEPIWAAKVRVKSTTNIMPGMPSMERAPARNDAAKADPAKADPAPTDPSAQRQDANTQQPTKPEINPLDVLKGIKGILGR